MHYSILLLIIITSGSVIGIEYKVFFNSLLVILLLLEIINYNFLAIKFRMNYILYIMLFVLYIISNVLSSITNNFNNISIMLFLVSKIVFISIYISILINKKIDVMKTFSYIIYYLSVISFVIYIMVFFNAPIPLVNTENIPIYIYLLKDFGNDFGGNELVRRTAGIFFEPGLYQIYLNLALIYFLNKRSQFIILFLLINIVLTYSPLAYILSFSIVFLYYIQMNLKYIVLSVFVLISFVLVLTFTVEFLIVKMDSMSYYLRFQDMIVGFKLFLENFIFGLGIGNNVIVKNYYLTDINIERGLSNGLLSLAYQTGIIGIFFYIFGFIKFIKSTNVNSKYVTFVMFLIISLINENIYLSNFYLFLVIYGYVRSKNEKNIIYRT